MEYTERRPNGYTARPPGQVWNSAHEKLEQVLTAAVEYKREFGGVAAEERDAWLALEVRATGGTRCVWTCLAPENLQFDWESLMVQNCLSQISPNASYPIVDLNTQRLIVLYRESGMNWSSCTAK
jgi:hypothetical protein